MAFFSLVVLLSIPLWIAGSYSVRFLPDSVPINLPISALMALNPVIAATILEYREHGWSGVRQLLLRVADAGRITNKAWYLPILFLWPVTMVLTYGLTRFLGIPLPAPTIPVGIAVLLAAAFFLSATGEELGWQGYAYPRMHGSALRNAIGLGAIWGAWHLIPLTQTHHTPLWVVAQTLGMIPFRILIVWLFNNTGRSIFGAIVFHASSNVSQFLYPTFGSHYDPVIPGLILTLVALLVVWHYGPQSLASAGSSQYPERGYTNVQ